jgi:hypothetical protein
MVWGFGFSFEFTQHKIKFELWSAHVGLIFKTKKEVGKVTHKCFDVVNQLKVKTNTFNSEKIFYNQIVLLREEGYELKNIGISILTCT